MKTADLIPFILFELEESDKYGFELTKNIETKSNGKIIIKQPTLYTLLKKLEKSKFISSYWQDSEIGGKRHYYRITENGKLQLSTLPSYATLIKKLDEDETDVESNISESAQPETPKTFSIIDELLNKNTVPLETILPSNEVFSSKEIDSATDLGINLTNANILKDEQTSSIEEFANNENVVKFTEKVEAPSASNYTVHTASDEFLNTEFVKPNNEIDVQYIDYVDFKKDEKNIKSKALTKNLLMKTLATSLSMLVLIVICSFITKYTGRTPLYYVFFFSAIFACLFYPIIFARNMQKCRLFYQINKYNPNYKKRILIALVIMLIILTTCIIVNICIGKNSIGLILHYNNFANIYAPILLSTTLLLDTLYDKIINKKFNIGEVWFRF